jgi:hypothetical protein
MILGVGSFKLARGSLSRGFFVGMSAAMWAGYGEGGCDRRERLDEGSGGGRCSDGG